MKDFRPWLAVQLLKHVSYELFGEHRVPKSKAEQIELTDRIGALMKRTELLTFKPEDWKDDIHPKQGWFIRSWEAQTRLFIGANQCLAGDELLLDPVSGRYRPIDSIRGPHFVQAWDGQKLVLAIAEQPFKKGVLPTLQIHLSTGNSFCCSPGHLLLTDRGWQPASEVLAGSLLFRPPSISAPCRSTRGEGGQRSTGTAPDSRGGYLLSLRSDDAPPRQEAGTASDAPPSRGDALERTRVWTHLSCGLSDGRARRRGRSRPRRVPVPLSSVGDPNLILDRFFASSGRVCDTAALPSIARRLAEGPPLVAVPDDPRSRLEAVLSLFGPSESADPCLNQPHFHVPSESSFLLVTRVEQIGPEVKWDFTVPTFHNYLHKGVIHHNTGKTLGIGAELLSWCLGFYPWNGKPVVFPGGRPWHQGMRFGLAGKDFINALSEDILPKMQALLPLKEMGCEFEKIQGRVISKISFPAPFYSSIKLLSYEMEPGKFEGYTWDGFAFNEPPPRYAYVGTKRGMMRNGAPILFAMTPLEEPWIKEELYDAENAVHITKESDLQKLTMDSVAVVTCDIADTPYIAESQKLFLAKGLDEDEADARLHGKFLHLTGRVYKNFEASKRVEKQDGTVEWVPHHVLDASKWYGEHPEWRKYPAFCVVDPHDRKPFAIAWGVVTPRGEKIFIREWPDFDITKVRNYKASMDEYAGILTAIEDELWKPQEDWHVLKRKAPILWRIMDPNFGRAKKATTGTSVEDEFAARGFYFDTSVDDDIPSGHIAVRNAFASDELFYLDSCKNMIRSTENYTWDEFRGKTEHAPKEKPRDKYKDFMDLVRYAIKFDMRYYQPQSLDRLMIPQGMKGGPR